MTTLALPGLGLTAPNSQNQQQQQQQQQQQSNDQPLQSLESRTIALTPGSEWRFEVSPDASISVKLLPSPPPTGDADLTGTAEIFGTELAPNHSYEFPGLTKAAVYTHHGCTLSVAGTCESDYTAEETPMTEYTNLHFALENLRATASQEMGGPRVLVVGPKDSGKTTLVKMLAAYATRSGRTPLVVSLDPSEGMLCLPGSISAAVMGTGAVLDVEDAAGGGWGSSAIGGSSAVPVKNPLVYHYGYAGPEERPEVFKPVATRLALAATSRFEEDEGVKQAGVLVDIGGGVCQGKAGLDVLSHVVSEFSSTSVRLLSLLYLKSTPLPPNPPLLTPPRHLPASTRANSLTRAQIVNVLLTLGSERLYSDLLKRFPTSHLPPDEQIHILRLPKSGGCVDRDDTYMRLVRQQHIRTYFFGTKRSPLSPHTLGVEWEGLGVLRMGDG